MMTDTTTREDALKQALRRDPINEAELITGKDSHNDDVTIWLGLAIEQQLSAEKQRLLENTGDTTFSNKLDRYVRIISSLGFERVLEIPFAGRSWGGSPAPQECFFVYFEPRRGILLRFDTHQGDNVNGGNFYYNWQPHDENFRGSHILSSGSFVCHDGELVTPLTWSGNHDCREALRLHINQLEQHGQFVTPWVKTPHLWLIHYNDVDSDLPWTEKSALFDELNRERKGMLPQFVKEACGIQ